MTRTLGSIALSLLLAAPAGAADWTGKVLRLGVDPTYPPLEYKQPDGRLAGFGIEIGSASMSARRPSAGPSPRHRVPTTPVRPTPRLTW